MNNIFNNNSQKYKVCVLDFLMPNYEILAILEKHVQPANMNDVELLQVLVNQVNSHAQNYWIKCASCSRDPGGPAMVSINKSLAVESLMYILMPTDYYFYVKTNFSESQTDEKFREVVRELLVSLESRISDLISSNKQTIIPDYFKPVVTYDNF